MNHAVDGKVACALTRSCAESLTNSTIGSEKINAQCERFVVGGGNEQRSITPDFSKAWNIAENESAPGQCRFQNG
jgi:hypothetical protein